MSLPLFRASLIERTSLIHSTIAMILPLNIIAIDPLHRLLSTATSSGLLAPQPGSGVHMSTSLFADDAILFASSTMHEIDRILDIVHSFSDATGLIINPDKSSVAVIRCDDINLDDVLQNFGRQRVQFPIKYLGLPITISRLWLVYLRFVLDQTHGRLAGWKGRLLSAAGRRVLVRCVLMAMSTFGVSARRSRLKLLKEIDKERRRSFWRGSRS
ncbi:hypothetical protein D1007_43179 [Hordeum vulgare]|nr:hypothetical protein D1007_43179 [Hordeum vulgare]